MKRIFKITAWLLVLLILVCGCSPSPQVQPQPEVQTQSQAIPEYKNSPYATVNNNQPLFTDAHITTEAYEEYGELDNLGRCTYAIASLGKEIMPTEERGAIGQVKPSGWHTVKYDVVDGKYLYNRCHLIGYQLSGENANTKNLITGTRYLNVEGMLPFENMVADYIKETGNHVAYRVTPIFEGSNLVASGVQIEALSIEDKGDGICFNVYCYNVQPGVEIDYASGESRLSGTDSDKTDEKPEQTEVVYILNTSSKKYHKQDCGSAQSISDKNRQQSTLSKSELENQGYSPAGCCKP